MNVIRQELGEPIVVTNTTSQNPKLVANLKRASVPGLKLKISDMLEKGKSYLNQFDLSTKSCTKESVQS